jgi:hypothetical protein
MCATGSVTTQSTQRSGPRFTTPCEMVTSSDSRGMRTPLDVNIKAQPWRDRGNHVCLCTRAVWRFGAAPVSNRSWMEPPTVGWRADGGSYTRAWPRQHSRCRYTTVYSPLNICHIGAGRRPTRKYVSPERGPDPRANRGLPLPAAAHHPG